MSVARNAVSRLSALARRWSMGVCVGALFGLSAPAQAYLLDIVPDTQTVGLGGSANVIVRVVDAQPDGVGAYDLELRFDPSILSFDHAIDGFGLGLALGLGTLDGGPGSLIVSDFSLESVADLLALQGNSFDLFTLVFKGVGEGTSAVDFGAVVLGDAAANRVTADLDGASVTVTAGAVPEPGSLALLPAAMLAALGLRARRARPVAAD